jgi:pimeloyl-ACP methyl ester carboxylesterase
VLIDWPLVPIKPSTISARGLRFDALTAGPADGELVILLHGFPQTASCWTAALTSLARSGYRAVAYSQRGYSPGAMPEGVDAYRLSEATDDLLAVADELGRRSFHVVGHDWGGAVAWDAAAAAPERIASMTAVSTPAPRALARALKTTNEQRLRMAYVPVLRAPLIAEGLFDLAGGAVAVRALCAIGLDERRAKRDVGALRETGIGNALNWYRAIGRDRRSDAGVTVPTLYIWGDRDPVFGRVAAEASGEFVDAPYHFVELQGASHWIPDEHWADVDDLLLDHLREHPAAVA